GYSLSFRLWELNRSNSTVNLGTSRGTWALVETIRNTITVFVIIQLVNNAFQSRHTLFQCFKLITQRRIFQLIIQGRHWVVPSQIRFRTRTQREFQTSVSVRIFVVKFG